MKSKDIKFIFLGVTQYSKEMLLFLIENGYTPKAIFYIPKRFKIKIGGKYQEKINFNFADLRIIAREYNIPSYEVNSVQGKKLIDYKNIIQELELDLILVLGWYYMIPKSIRNLAKYGAWGIHASLLPKYAGGAPLVWAIINGEKETGVTLFRMEDGVDDGDIIAQRKFAIEFEDTIKEVYEKATQASKEILLDVLEKFPEVSFKKQDKSKIEVYPQRNPEDGEINWNWPALKIYNFIRAQTEPYPGAFTYLKDIKIKILHSKITEIYNKKYKPGQIVLVENKTLVATQDKFLELGVVDDGQVRDRFENYARVKRLGGVFRSRNCLS